MWNVMTLRINRGAFRWRHFIPFVFVAGVALSVVISLLEPVLRYAFLAVLGPYAVASVLSSLQISAKAGMRHLCMLPWLFLLYHATYGLGTWSGLLRSLSGSWKA